MNQRDSSGLPIRAMVMVLLFLGVVFLLVALQSLGGDDDTPSAGSTTVTTSATTTSAAPEEPARADVRVFNISETPGAAEAIATRLRDAEWNVTDTGNLVVPDVTVTTVYFGEAPGEQEAAEEVGRLLEAPVAPRVPELTEQPPGVVVLVTG
ncbi:LytR C-terminal domain-containing protein [Mycobacterium sp. ITM-2016-00317]|uniref:LytR C-terminal domain-containing protein n=1 Tax=Mycobacterium sp. ITM-2016-00317 TaxID=2099694 RepID=UPI000D4473B7|nr:LytR C-terminal domain-containing protein [Mycobacterium sp. ITM-2016-00317]WNG88273.1 LytR C-terminal domain-containing protein [Mycobacterium sp. ITM-2016-00317]